MNQDYNLLLNRLYDNRKDTLGILYYLNLENMLKYVFTLEDEYRETKVPGETRIWAGQYKLGLRKEGGFYNRYCEHKNLVIREFTRKYGMIQILDVSQFKYILLHPGNRDKDTAGCITMGNETINNSQKTGYICESILAYIDLVSPIYRAMELKKDCYINILDTDREIQKQYNLI